MSISPLGLLLGESHGRPGETPSLAGCFEGDRILAPLLAPQAPTAVDQIKVAATLARASDASLSLINPLPASGQTRDDDGDGVTDESEAPLDRALEATVDTAADANGSFLPTRSVVAGVLQSVTTSGDDTLVLPGGSARDRLHKSIVERIAAHAACDVVVVNGQAGYEKAASILLPIAGGPHSGLAADLARSIAADCDAWVDVLHVIDEDATEREREAAEDLVREAYHRIGRPETTTTWVLEADDVAEAIAEQSRYYGLTVMGAPTKGPLRRLISGSTTHSVRSSARSVVLSARNNGSRSSDID